MGARTDAARAEVLAARAGLEQELIRLEASGRAAVDIPARLRREPAKVLGTAGGAAFLLLGGPQRVFRGVRRAIQGPRADLPKSMLPKEIDRHLKKLGDDGERVRTTIEREFANYLDSRSSQRKERDLAAVAGVLLTALVKPFTDRLGRQLAEQAFAPDSSSFATALRRARGRRSDAPSTPGSTDEAPL